MCKLLIEWSRRRESNPQPTVYENHSRPVPPVRSHVFSVGCPIHYAGQKTPFGHEYAPENAPPQCDYLSRPISAIFLHKEVANTSLCNLACRTTYTLIATSPRLKITFKLLLVCQMVAVSHYSDAYTLTGFTLEFRRDLLAQG